MFRWIRWIPAFVLAEASASTALASNGLHPRTPALFPDDLPCVETIVRGEHLHVEYAVPYDDTALTRDELPDSRRHQFFAFAEQRHDFRLPTWISQADYDRALANGDIETLGDRPILENDLAWPPATWQRITPDHMRLPITKARAAIGVDWDTEETQPGTWMVSAYTWEPEYNLWSHRYAAVRVVDPMNPNATGPTVFLQHDVPPILRVGQRYTQPGCVEAPEGSTITASWGLVVDAATPTWQSFLEDEAVVDGPLALQFQAPAESIGVVKLRVEIVDPTGRSYVAFSPQTIAVLAPRNDDPEPTESPTESEATQDGTTATGSDASSGCGCRANVTGWPVAVLPWVAIRGRKDTRAAGSSRV